MALPFPDYERFDALGLANLVKTGVMSPREIVTAALARIAARNPALNAVIDLWADEALAAADQGPHDRIFSGVPFLVKDLLASVGGYPFRQGSRAFADCVARDDSTLIRRYRAAGLILIGKTNTPEFGLVPVTEPTSAGPCRNPWNHAHTPGGSSGGSAAAIAAGMVPMAHANDGGGSIRVPASCCGLFGLKPSRGRLPLGPVIGQAWQGLITDHAITRTVRDSAALLDATAGRDPGAPYDAPPPHSSFSAALGQPLRRLRIGMITQDSAPLPVDQACWTSMHAAGQLCEALGHRVDLIHTPIAFAALHEEITKIIESEVAAELIEAEPYLGHPLNRRLLEPATLLMARLGGTLSAVTLSRAIRAVHRAARTMGDFHQRYDLLLTPTLGQVPPAIGAVKPNWLERVGLNLVLALHLERTAYRLGAFKIPTDRIWRFMAFTALANATGQPAMSIPFGHNPDNLPIGVQFIGPYGDEETLFQLAQELEQAAPWFDRRPDF